MKIGVFELTPRGCGFALSGPPCFREQVLKNLTAQRSSKCLDTNELVANQREQFVADTFHELMMPPEWPGDNNF